ncbi:MAG: NAD(P)H-binding protein [Anaerolineaceae bacterium]|nr:NAD(P)H-binding protein [Anaerolineaceae bacterium]
MKLIVTGATGFTGSHTVPLLIQSGFQLRCLSRPESDRSPLRQLDIEWINGDLNDQPSLINAMQGCQGLVNIASLGFGHAGNIISAAQSAGIQRSVFISTTAIFTRLNASSKQVRLAAEEAIQESNLPYTILRPTMIYGSPRDRNIWRLIQFIMKYPLIPVLGDGSHFQQPVFVDDVANAILSVLKSDHSINKSYNIAGQQALTYNQMIDVIAHQLNKKISKLHFSAKIAVQMLSFFEKIHLPFPIKSEQVLRLNENKDFSYAEASQDFQFQPLSFEKGIALELNYLSMKND